MIIIKLEAPCVIIINWRLLPAFILFQDWLHVGIWSPIAGDVPAGELYLEIVAGDVICI